MLDKIELYYQSGFKVFMLERNYAFIDSQNLNLGILDQGWILDFGRFRIFLMDKYKVSKAFLFIGYVPGNESLYSRLQQFGYICIFKPTMELTGGRIKGNVDAELVLHTMIELTNFNKAVIVTGDGDFHCLIEYLLNTSKLSSLIVPNKYKYSAFLKKKEYKPYTRYMNEFKNKLEYKKRPYEDETS